MYSSLTLAAKQACSKLSAKLLLEISVGLCSAPRPCGTFCLHLVDTGTTSGLNGLIDSSLLQPLF